MTDSGNKPIPTASQTPPGPVPDWLGTIARVRLIELPRYARDDGEIVVAQAFNHVPFAMARAFTLTAPRGARRGEHAHRRCTQFMLCVHGAVDVLCDDSRDKEVFTLDRNNLALCVPPTIWNTLIFKEDRSVVLVLCDRLFEEADYLREYGEFLAFREANQ
ncbi:MAG TPA: FdtA/QdtA family cupin domain-containing protein [Xanthobacteraceae bacterium]|nr:FdtA/QdtA family cupin domain-containing protein [Xanthobacteraceae bacterium]